MATRAEAFGTEVREKADFPSFQGHGHRPPMGGSFPDNGGTRTGKFAQMAQIARAQAPPVRRRHPAQSLLSIPRSTPSSAHFMPHFKQLSVLRDARAVT